MTDGRSGSSMSQRNASKVCIWDSPLCVCDSVTLEKPLSILELPFILDNTIIIHRIFFFSEISKWQHILNKVCHYFFWSLFLMWTICVKSLLNLLQHCFCFIFWCFGPKACRILPTRDREEGIHRAWTPSQACLCWSCVATSPVDSELCA